MEENVINQITNDNNSIEVPTLYVKKMIDHMAKSNNIHDYRVTIKSGNTEGENFFGKIYKVHIESEEKSIRAILKVAPDDPLFRSNLPLREYYCREIDAYKLILPEMDRLQTAHSLEQKDRFPFIKCHAANRDEFKESLLIEDVSIEGFKMYDKLTSLDLDHAVIALKNLARFHAISFALKREDPNLFETLTEHVLRESNYGKHFPKFLDQNKGQVLKVIEEEDVRDRLADYMADANSKLKILLDPTFTEPYNVICHGDCWNSNLLFKYENDKVVDVRTIDWQVIRLASPITDLAYLIFTSTDEKFRSKHFHQLLDLYYATLSENVAKMGCDIDVCYPESIYREHIKKIFPFGLIICIALCPILLSDRDVVPDLGAAGEKFNNEEENGIKLSKTPKERLRGIARDCIKYNFI